MNRTRGMTQIAVEMKFKTSVNSPPMHLDLDTLSLSLSLLTPANTIFSSISGQVKCGPEGAVSQEQNDTKRGEARRGPRGVWFIIYACPGLVFARK